MSESVKISLGLALHFTSLSTPALWKIIFKKGTAEISIKRKTGKADTNGFDWKPGTQGLTLALLNYKLSGWKKGGFYEFSGRKVESPAASACSVIEKQQWLQGAFGSEGDSETDIAKEVFKVAKAQSDTVAFKIDADRLPPERIKVYSDDKKKELSDEEIQKLLNNVKWSPHRVSSPSHSDAHSHDVSQHVHEPNKGDVSFQSDQTLFHLRPPSLQFVSRTVYGEFFKACQAMQQAITLRFEGQNSVTIRALGMSMGHAWPFLVNTFQSLIKKECGEVHLHIALLDYQWKQLSKINPTWADRARVVMNEIRRYANDYSDVFKEKHWTLRLSRYAHMPYLHGLLVDDDLLFESTCFWREGRLTGAENQYVLLTVNDETLGIHRISQFKSWFDYIESTGFETEWPESSITATSPL